jgi:hypothetical protein
MKPGETITALVAAYVTHDDSGFRSIVRDYAADQILRGHNRIAQDLKALLEENMFNYTEVKNGK